MSAGPSRLDSARFGIEVARVVVPAGDRSTSLDAVEAAIADLPARVHVVRYPADRVAWFATLAGRHAHVVHAATLVYWSTPVAGAGSVGALPAAGADAPRLRPVVPAAAERTVRATFADYPHHYAANPLFPPGQVLDGYGEWARTAAVAGRAWGLHDGADLVGLATVSVQGRVLEVELAGIVPGRQRQGWYARLLAGVRALAAEQGCDRVVISTQAGQVHVQRSWARQGLVPVAALETVHLMSGPDAPG